MGAAGARATAPASAGGGGARGAGGEEREPAIDPFASARGAGDLGLNGRGHRSLLLEEVFAAHAHVLVGRHPGQDTTRDRRSGVLEERSDLRRVLRVVQERFIGEPPGRLVADLGKRGQDHADARAGLLSAPEDLLEAHRAGLVDLVANLPK